MSDYCHAGTNLFLGEDPFVGIELEVASASELVVTHWLKE